MPALVLWIYRVRAVCLQFLYLSPRGHKRAAAAPSSISAFKEGRREKRQGGWKKGKLKGSTQIFQEIQMSSQCLLLYLTGQNFLSYSQFWVT